MKSISDLIKTHLRETGTTQAHLADLIGISRQNLYKRLRSHDLTVSFVYHISVALKYDFFAIYTKRLESEGIITRDDTYKNKDFREKYYSVLEENRELYGKVNRTAEELEEYKKRIN